jgi:hypothetical protein
MHLRILAGIGFFGFDGSQSSRGRGKDRFASHPLFFVELARRAR